MNRRRERRTTLVARAVLAIALGAAVLSGCGLSDDAGGGDDGSTTTTASSTPDSTESTTTTVEGELPSGPPGEGCVEGWTTPPPGSPKRQEPLDLIRAQMGLTGLFKVDAMRYFQGPEVPWITDPRPQFVERWYVKASLVDDPSVRARWIVERRNEDVRGISAVAPFDTTGYESPEWRAFTGEGDPVIVPGLPGQWSGVNYDFVTGEGDSGNPGLPEQNLRCLDGT
jgi:hypothetical protein